MKKTKFAYASDIHLEFGKPDFEFPDADILLLAGDICPISDLQLIHTSIGNSCLYFFKTISEKYSKVIWVAGNHEWYYSNMVNGKSIIDKFFKSHGIDNIEFSAMGTYLHNNVKIVFATLWTDINKANPIEMIVGSNTMNDYVCIDNGKKKLTPSDTVSIHLEHRKFIEKECSNFSGNIIVMSHHQPVISEKISGRMQYFYGSTDMENIILDNPNIKKWIFGHAHSREKIVVGETEIMSNCRGYHGIEKQTKTFKVKTFLL